MVDLASLPLWPWRPLPEIEESWDWDTDVMQGPQAEARVSLHDGRQSVQYDCVLSAAQAADAEALVRANPVGEWAVPVWFEAVRVLDISAADTTLTVGAGSWVVGGSVAIWAGCAAVIIAEVSAVDGDDIGLTAAVGVDIASAQVMPLRDGFMASGLALSRLRGGRARCGVRFVLREGGTAPATPWPQYLDLDLVARCGIVRPLRGDIVPSANYLDNRIGRIAIEPLRDVLAGRFEMVWMLSTAAARHARRGWLQYLRGRDRAFWLADNFADFTLAATVLENQTFMDVAPLGGTAAQIVGRHVLIDDGAGYLPRAIEAAAVVGDVWRLTIVAPGRDITAARVSWLRLVRLDSDAVRLRHVVGLVTEVSLPLVEVVA